MSNNHGTGSGEPPQIDGDTEGRYHGYFENEHGEQAISVIDCQAGTGPLRLGDASWERSLPVADGGVPQVILGEGEALWLKACWQAATAFRAKQ